MLLQKHIDKVFYGIFYKDQERHGLSMERTFSLLGSRGLENLGVS